MRKKVFGAKLSRERATRSAMFVSMVESLVNTGSIKTTKPKAKAIVSMVDKLVVLAKKDSLSSKRQVLKKLRNNKRVATILWTDVAKTFKNRNSGFTRIVPLLQRKGDLAQMVKLQWVEPVEISKTKKELKEEKIKQEKKEQKGKKKVTKTSKSKAK